MVPNGSIATIGERARAPVTNTGHVIWISTELPGGNSTKPSTDQQSKPTAISTAIINETDKFSHILSQRKKLMAFEEVKKILTWP